MAKFIGLQAGHQNIQNNIDPLLHASTGAPGEVALTVRVRDRLGQLLNSKKNADGSKAFMVQLDDANANGNSNTTGKDFDFYLALHGEADVHNLDGGMISAPDPTYDDVNAESKRIVAAIASEYFNNAGITQRPNWISINMTRYYMWRALSSKTPCGLLEMGVVQNAHDKVILADTDRVANAIARGLCKAFNVPFDAPTPVPTPVPPVPTPTPPVQTTTIPTTEYMALKAKEADYDNVVKAKNAAEVALGKARDAAPKIKFALTEAGL